MHASPASSPSSGALARWLLCTAALVFSMVVLGGAVRLTRSGLSITEWRPVTGVVPPLSRAAWEEAFAKYRETPEYRKVHRDLTLGEFRFLYWMEWAHRLLGRLVGLVFGLPLLVGLLRRRLPAALARRLLLVLGLGALQGWIGWFMVQSGLVDVPRVSPYRLALHLLVAVAIYLLLLHTAWGLASPRVGRARRRGALPLLFFALLVLASGAFVAGNHAGFVFNTFPKMGGRWVPEGLWRLEPAWRNAFENVVLVQFLHRVLAVTFVAAVLVWALRRGRPDRARALVGAAALLQATLGVSTLLLGVPIPLAVAHQAGAMLVVTALAWAAFGAPGREGGSSPQPRRKPSA